MANRSPVSRTPKKVLKPACATKVPFRFWEGVFDTLDQTWIFTIKVDGKKHCTLIDPDGDPVAIFLKKGTYTIVFPSGSKSPLESLAIDPDPGTGRRIP
ncbi:MAG: hypothetical protein NTW40_14150 [Acidobacteria bacterium]|nr:hypothetical protein [Acidobacteriota bacterium]